MINLLLLLSFAQEPAIIIDEHTQTSWDIEYKKEKLLIKGLRKMDVDLDADGNRVRVQQNIQQSREEGANIPPIPGPSFLPE